MRCPKCGFISFDHLENCKKCHKPIGDIAAELNGTTYNANAPQFLTLVSADAQPAPPTRQSAEGEETVSLFADEESFDLGESPQDANLFEQEAEPSPEREEIEFAGFDTETSQEVADDADMSPIDAFALDNAAHPEEKEPVMPAIDFGDLDISDLAPPSAEQPDTIRFEQPPVLSDVEPVATLSPTPVAPPSSPKSASGLEDLNFEGLDLDTPAKLISQSAAGKRFLPSVKTGTALDKFEIDLGDLFTENKK